MGHRIAPPTKRGSWELRVYQGIDPATRESRYATRTVRGSRRVAQRAVQELTVEVDHARIHAGTVGDLLERWYTDATPAWAPTTAAHTRAEPGSYDVTVKVRDDHDGVTTRVVSIEVVTAQEAIEVAAEFLAVEALGQVTAAVQPPSKGQAKQLD